MTARPHHPVRDGSRDGSALGSGGQAEGPLPLQLVPTAAEGPRHPQGRSEPRERRTERSEVDGERSRGSLPAWGAVPRCPVCSNPLPSARARFCSAACRQRAFRLRHTDRSVPDEGSLRRALRRQRTLVAYTVYACPSCEERFLGVRRCPECNLFTRVLGLGGPCPECDSVILVADLLGKEVLR
jgi:hypothetical protein